MTSHFARGSISSRFISTAKQYFAQFKILLVLAAQVVFALEPMQTNAGSGNLAQEPKEVRQLEVGKAIEREIAGAESHSYKITLAAGQYLNVVVEQRGIDVVVALLGPDGKQIAEVDSEARKQGRETVMQVAEVTGSYHVEVKPKLRRATTGRYEIRVVELRTATEKDLVLQEASNLRTEFLRLYRAGKLDEALPVAERVLELRVKVLGPEHPDVAAALNNLAIINNDKGNYAEAERLHQRALVIREKAFGPEHQDVAASLIHLANLYRDKGDYAQAEQLHQRALEIMEKALGLRHELVANSLTNFANLNHEKGDYAKAELQYQRALSIWEEALEPEDPLVATALNNLAVLYGDKGDYKTAKLLHHRALGIREKAYGQKHVLVATSLSNLGVIYRNEGDYNTAEQMLQRALEIREEKLGPKHSDVATSLDNLANVYRYKGKGYYVKAESLYKRALEMREETLRPGHPRIATSLNNLADLYREQGVYAEAEPLYQRALVIREKALGPKHPLVATPLNNLAGLYAATGDLGRAITFQSRASEVTEHNIALNLATGSERQKLAYLSSLSNEYDRAISLHIRITPNNPDARDLATTIILRRKGRVLDAMSDSFATLRRRASPQDQVLFDQLQVTNAQLARLVLNEPQRITPDEYLKRIKALEEQKENLEAKISQSSDELRAQSQPVTLASVKSAIPTNAALVEFVVYRPFNAKYSKISEQFGSPHYAAYLLRSEGGPQWVELGEAQTIDEAVGKWREALRDPKRTDVKQLARKVEALVMQPVCALLGRTQRVLISPDGALNLIPFAALVDEHNRYLVERFSITYLTSGRDLLRLQVARESKSHPLIVADPDFGALAGEDAQLAHNSRGPTAHRQARGPIRNISQAYFEPLPETGREAKELKTLLPQATVLTKEQATEIALKQALAPRILHIATHGFFLEDSEALTANVRIENPLLRSGLVLAGFNQHKSGADDGMLTSLEATGLDLWGTKLVVLSACDTGVGEVKSGEGVYGLRRALVLAGAESLVMSLWSVSDYWTRRLMVGYYTALQQGQGRGAALRQVQLQMLKSKSQRHPYYWASFIQSGEWANLDGKR